MLLLLILSFSHFILDPYLNDLPVGLIFPLSFFFTLLLDRKYCHRNAVGSSEEAAINLDYCRVCLFCGFESVLDYSQLLEYWVSRRPYQPMQPASIHWHVQGQSNGPRHRCSLGGWQDPHYIWKKKHLFPSTSLSVGVLGWRRPLHSHANTRSWRVWEPLQYTKFWAGGHNSHSLHAVVVMWTISCNRSTGFWIQMLNFLLLVWPRFFLSVVFLALPWRVRTSVHRPVHRADTLFSHSSCKQPFSSSAKE